jgi:hypothetical protein
VCQHNFHAETLVQRLQAVQPTSWLRQLLTSCSKRGGRCCRGSLTRLRSIEQCAPEFFHACADVALSPCKAVLCLCKLYPNPCKVVHKPCNVCSSLITCGMSSLQICKGCRGLVGRWSISSLQQQDGAQLLSDPYSGRASLLKNGHIKFARHPTSKVRWARM